MYIGRRSRYNKFVPIRAIGADSLIGGIAPLILVGPVHFTAREKALVFTELEAAWVL